MLTLAEETPERDRKADFVANVEVGEARWCGATEACALLSYRDDCGLVEAFVGGR